MTTGTQSRQVGPWSVEFAPEDGARLCRLAFAGEDLLTRGPAAFRPPVRDLGRYELRPVYGYDDCWPTVDPCGYPGTEWTVPDHGELCWLPWRMSEGPDSLSFAVESRALPATFTRALSFRGNTLTWAFEVVSRGERALPFLHVMHPLMPLDRVKAIGLPAFAAAIDELSGKDLPLAGPKAVSEWLLRQPRGAARMILLRNVGEGKLAVTFAGGTVVDVAFPAAIFPTLAIWWNNGAYPDEEGLRRCECAFEPSPGNWSGLAKSWREGTFLSVKPGAHLAWQVTWRIQP
jgi:hypothetical protein